MRARAAFSLVEVTMALGILTFALVAIVGLLNVGLNAAKSAQIDTMQSTISRSLVASIRTNSPANYTGGTNWYMYDGSPSPDAGGAYFQCVVSTNSPPSSISPTNMVSLRVEFQYPVTASPTNQIKKSLHASIVRQP